MTFYTSIIMCVLCIVYILIDIRVYVLYVHTHIYTYIYVCVKEQNEAKGRQLFIVPAYQQ